MRELLEGRRIGFALRPPLAAVAVGLGAGALVLDLMSWFAWGVRETNALVVGALWLVVATAIVAFLALLVGFAELADVADEDRQIARIDIAGGALAVLLYALSAFIRAGDIGAAAAGPISLLLTVAGLLLLIVDAALASVLYAAREWEEIEDAEREQQRHRRAVTR